MERMAFYDTLTNLANRRLFYDRLGQVIEHCRRSHRLAALLYLDLDQFKRVNDTLGHEVGDLLLQEVGGRLVDCVRKEDTVARPGGDEFTILLYDIQTPTDASIVAEKILQRLRQPLNVSGHQLVVTTSIGIAIIPEDGTDPNILMKNSDLAMYRAKESGGARFAFYDDTLNEANRHRVFVESRLRNAIKKGELNVHFQPKLKLADRSVETAEALLRWTDAKLGVVPPDTFVPIAEETSLIYDFMSILVDKTASLLSSAEQSGITLDTIAINISQKQLMAGGFALSLLSLLDRRNLPHRHIEIEVTESVFAKDTQQVVRELEILRQAGMKIALDDFGTGFSSLNMLRELPLDVVKIDRSFITELETSDQARSLVQHLISIAATLGKEVVAEGVETEVQLEHLITAKCDYVQGFLVSKAKPEEEFIRMLSLWQSDSSSMNLKNAS